MEKEQVIEFLKKRIKEVDTLSDFEKWNTTTKRILERVYGSESSQLKDFSEIKYSGDFIVYVHDTNETLDNKRREHFQKGLNHAKSVLQGIVEEIENFGLLKQEKESEQNPKQVFNIHQNQVVNVTIENILKNCLTDSQFNELNTILKEEKNKQQKENKIVGFLKKIGETTVIEILKSLLI